MNKKSTSMYRAALLGLMAALVIVLPVLAQTGISIDGAFTDWTSKANLIDLAVDDEAAPGRSDITEFRADSSATGIYLMMAWDDTEFTGGNATTVGVTYRNHANAYYRIYATASGVPGLVSISPPDITIGACVAGGGDPCKSETVVCEPKAANYCTLKGVTFASSTAWSDPFKTSTACSGTNCATNDTAVEMYIPFDAIGGAPSATGQFSYMTYHSYPSGPGKGSKDVDGNGNTGIACRNENGTVRCYRSDPTAITLTSFEATTPAASALIPAGLALLALTSLFLLKRR